MKFIREYAIWFVIIAVLILASVLAFIFGNINLGLPFFIVAFIMGAVAIAHID